MTTEQEPKVEEFPVCPRCSHSWHGFVCNRLDEQSLRQGRVHRCTCPPPCFDSEVQR